MEGEREVPNNITLDTLFTLSAEIWTFNPVKGVINSLITSGKVDLIKNDSLKFHLTNWNDIVDDYREDRCRSGGWVGFGSVGHDGVWMDRAFSFCSY